jgi:hypothetical protein
VRYSELSQLVDEVLGTAQGPVLMDTLRLGALDDRTAAAALAEGVEPRDVWHALCDELDVPPERRFGSDRRRQAPPRRHRS